MVGASSCSEKVIDSPQPDQTKAISFSNIATKAGLSDLQANGFGVWTFIDNTATQNYVLMNNQKVEYNASTSTWEYSPLKYWMDETTFYFVASYSDNESSKMGTTIYQENAEDPEYYYLTQEVTVDQNAAFDPLVAANITDTNIEGYATTVPLQFGHIMTKINFIVKKNKTTNETDTFLLDKITVKGIKNKGTYVVIPVEGGDGLPFMQWTVDSESTIEFVKEFNGTEVGYASGEEINFSNDGLLLIPQSIDTETVEVIFNFRYGLEGATDVSTYTAKEVSVYLPASSDLWASGKSINYIIQLSTSDFINFEQPVVTPWGGMQSGGTIIIK